MTHVSYSNLAAPFTPQEIQDAINKMGSWKAPGQYEIPLGVYKENWDTLGPHITSLALQMLQGLQSMAPFNYTDIVLIPKNMHTISPADFYPISICNTRSMLKG